MDLDLSFDPGPVVIGIVFTIALAAFIFLIWMLVDAIRRPAGDFSTPAAKMGWIAGMGLGLLFGFGPIVAVVYLVAVRLPAKRRDPGNARPAPPISPAPPPVPPPAS